jgi:hypothetical protein
MIGREHAQDNIAVPAFQNPDVIADVRQKIAGLLSRRRAILSALLVR